MLNKSIASIAAALFLAAFCASQALADRIILTPSPTTLAPDAGKLDVEQSVGPGGVSEVLANLGSPYAELEIGALQKRGSATGEASLETQLLPETGQLPSLAFGIRDIGNTTYHYGQSGYHGIAPYVVMGRTPVKYADAPYPLRNLSYTFGCGVLGDRWTVRIGDCGLAASAALDSRVGQRNLNERLSLTLTSYSALQLDRQGSTNLIGLTIFTPLTIF